MLKRIQRRDLSERTLRLEVEEPVQLPDALVEEFLRERISRGDGEVDVAHARHQVRLLARSLVVSLAMQRLPGGRVVVRPRGEGKREAGGEEREGKSVHVL